RQNKKWLLVISVALLAILAVKTTLFLTAKPKITVDYVAEYNRTARPQDYDPNDNAAPYYQKAFDAFVDMPDELRKPHVNWPTDFNDAEQALLEKWLISNTLAFEYLRGALSKPYYWLERKVKRDNYIGSMTTPDLGCLRELTEALGWNAKFNAVKGQFQHAFENILECYSAGMHKCRPNLLVIEQHVGLRIKQDAVRNALIILDKSKVENEALAFLQNALQAELNNDDYVPSMQAEKYLHYDALQRTFIDNGKGTGRLAWRTGWYYDTLRGKWNNFRKRLHACFVGPTRNEIVGQIEKVLTISGQMMTKMPWQIKNEGSDYFEEIENINNSNWFLQIFGVSPKSIFHSYYETKAQTEALITVLAILRYKTDTGQFPETLNELISLGYLKAVPNDPYSNSALVYKLTEDGFKLYSVGKDFSDDGGMIEVVNEAMQMPGFRKTGIIPRVHSPDIVYWPVRDLEKLRYEFTFKQAERLRVEKEAEAQRKIEEANKPE
ncbi:MAG: hypothetical protein J7M30_13825, partial [Deltaproteobacteria bacterium]|nr:hypothetical protein [Deltaproteobacteria bacterium]